MKVIELAKEAERLNVPFEFVSETYEKALKEGKIYGLLVPKKEEIIQYKPDEIYNLIDRLRSNSITPKELESELKLENAYVILVLDFLLKENRIRGVLTHKGTFLTNPILKQQTLEAIQKNGKVEVTEISTQLSVSESEVSRVVEEISSQVLTTIAPYKQIKIKDLGAEVGISEGTLLPLLKRIISERRVSAQLDMINDALVIDEHRVVADRSQAIERDRNSVDRSSVRDTTESHASYSSPPNKPTSAWYLVAFLFGIIGGLVGYVAVKDDDPDMAGNLLGLGILTTIIGAIAAWLIL